MAEHLTDPTGDAGLPGQPAPMPAEPEPATPAAVVEKFDVNKLLLGEVAKIEELAGAGVGALADKLHPKGLLLAAIVYVIKKRTNPGYTFGMAQTLSLGEASELIGDDDDEEDDTEAPGAEA